MLSNTLENMSDDLNKNGNINNYLEEIPDNNKLKYLNLAIEELYSFINNKTNKITKLFSSIFIVGALVSIVLSLWFLPMINNVYEQKHTLDEKAINYELKGKTTSQAKSDILHGQQMIENDTIMNSKSANLVFYTLGAGLLISIVAFILPAIYHSFSRVSLKKYKTLLNELKEQRYIYLSNN